MTFGMNRTTINGRYVKRSGSNSTTESISRTAQIERTFHFSFVCLFVYLLCRGEIATLSPRSSRWSKNVKKKSEKLTGWSEKSRKSGAGRARSRLRASVINAGCGIEKVLFRDSNLICRHFFFFG